MGRTLFYISVITAAFALGAFSVLGVDALRQQGNLAAPIITERVVPANQQQDTATASQPLITPADINIKAAPTSFAPAVKLAAPAVVTIYTSRADNQRGNSPFFSQPFNDPFFEEFFGDAFGPPNNERSNPDSSRQLRSLGSGVVIDESGLIVSNHHVTSYADSIFVNLPDGTYTRAEIVGGDPETDLVLLRAEETDNYSQWPVIPIGDDELIEVGDWVLAIGNPFSVGQTVTQGIVSAVGRSNVGVTTYENFIQTDAAINPGNSGGALINVQGELLGINTAIFSRSGGSHGIGFAIPVSTVLKVVDQLRYGGQVSRGWMGVYLRDAYPSQDQLDILGKQRNIFIAGVYEGGPADDAGVLSGDQVLSIDEEEFEDSKELSAYVAEQAPGNSIILKVQRGEEEVELVINLGTRPPPSSRQ